VHEHLELSHDDKFYDLEWTERADYDHFESCLMYVNWQSLVCVYLSATESYTAFISSLQHFVRECIPQYVSNKVRRVFTSAKRNLRSFRQCYFVKKNRPT